MKTFAAYINTGTVLSFTTLRAAHAFNAGYTHLQCVVGYRGRFYVMPITTARRYGKRPMTLQGRGRRCA